MKKLIIVAFTSFILMNPIFVHPETHDLVHFVITMPPQMLDCTVRCVGISAPNRDELIYYLGQESVKYDSKPFHLRICMEEEGEIHEIVLNSLSDIPHSSIRVKGKPNWWYIKYDNNKGYMDIEK